LTDYKTALETHFNEIKDFKSYSKGHGYLLFGQKAEKVDEDYGKLIPEVKVSISEMENELLSGQADFEKSMMKIYKTEPEQARELLTDYSLKQIQKALEMAKQK
jgi:hypothetical protein